MDPELLITNYTVLNSFLCSHNLNVHWILLMDDVEHVAAAAAAAKSLQSCPTVCDPIDCSPSGSPIPGILQARTPVWVAISFSNAWKWKVKTESEAAQSCPNLSDPMDCSLPGSSDHRIFQARVLQWVAIALSTHWGISALKFQSGFMKEHSFPFARASRKVCIVISLIFVDTNLWLNYHKIFRLLSCFF